MVFTASTFMQVILMQRLLDYTPLADRSCALARLPGAVAGVCTGCCVADRFDHRVIMLCALSVFALFRISSPPSSLEWPVRWIVWLVALRFGCGSFVYAPMTATALAQLSPGENAPGFGCSTSCRMAWAIRWGLPW